MTLLFFSVRGFLRYRKYKKEAMVRDQEQLEREDKGDGRFEEERGKKVGTSVDCLPPIEDSYADFERRVNSHAVMRPSGTLLPGIPVVKQLGKINPRILDQKQTPGNAIGLTEHERNDDNV